nr:hypothetical protein Hi04_10k_c5190_00029 [uncultured bacterium]
MNEDLALWRERSLRDSGLAKQTLGSSHDFIAACFEGDRHQESSNQSEWDADGERCQEMDAHFRDRRINQEQAAQRQKNDASDGQDSMGGKLGLGSKQSECAQNESQCGEPRRKKIKRKGGQQDKNYAHGSWDHCAGMVEFDIER